MKYMVMIMLGGLLALSACGGAPAASPQASDDSGASQVTPANTDLEGVTWRLAGFGGGEGAAAPLAGSEVTAVFSDDGEPRISGSAGCNTYTAGLVREGEAFTVSMPVATKKLCQEPGVMEQEQAFLAALSAARGAAVRGDELTLTDAGGVVLLTFTAR
jgi:heat shock protein HslJ